jgi:hypothetical protein
MEVADVYNLAEEEISEVQDHLELIQSRKINKALTALTFFLTPIATALALCAAPPLSGYLTDSGKVTWWLPWLSVVLIISASLGVAGIAMWLSNRSERSQQ